MQFRVSDMRAAILTCKVSQMSHWQMWRPRFFKLTAVKFYWHPFLVYLFEFASRALHDTGFKSWYFICNNISYCCFFTFQFMFSCYLYVCCMKNQEKSLLCCLVHSELKKETIGWFTKDFYIDVYFSANV